MATLAAAAVIASGLGGCTSHAAPVPPDAAATFQLTVDVRIPSSAASPSGTVSPSSTAPPGATSAVKMSGVWDAATSLARMQGTVNAVPTTILSAAGVEYVSLTPAMAAASGKKWLKADNSNATFGDFWDPHVVAQLLRAFHEVRTVSAGHLGGTIDTAEADQHIADPNLVGSLAGYPDVIRFDLWTDGSGAPARVLFTLAGAGPVTTGTAQLDSFGTAAPQVDVPTIDQVVQGGLG